MRLLICILATLVLSISLKAQSGQGTVKGKLITDDGKPAAFVTVFLKDTRLKVLSNEEGNYVFNNIADGNYTVMASFVGLQTQSFPVSLANGETKIIDFKLKENAEELQEERNSSEHNGGGRDGNAQPAGAKT